MMDTTPAFVRLLCGNISSIYERVDYVDAADAGVADLGLSREGWDVMERDCAGQDRAPP